MRTRTITKHMPPQTERPTFVLRLNGVLWAWIVQHPMVGIRLPANYAVPPDYIQEADQDAIDLVHLVDSQEPPVAKTELLVERGDTTTIGGVLVDTATLDAIEELHPAVAWKPFRRWLAGWNADGELVTIWRMPEGISPAPPLKQSS